ncbi:mandelate racemase/muconate lactonizing enzyme family protein [Paenibacillus sp.]|uniref:mandelate racemase/muconate lactonizing enzyme family protein n=1 Tax=Paenibacillus sp. TaxID=58172 RepID=UPI003463A332
MLIHKIDTYPLLYRIPRPYGDANGLKKFRSTYLIRITTKSGLTGWGECSGWLPSLKAEFEQAVIPFLLGKDARERNSIIAALTKQKHDRPAAAVSMALTEIVANHAKLSAWELWGGAVRRSLPVYASFQSYSETMDWMNHSLRDIEGAVLQGFTNLKIKVGGKALNDDIRHVRAIQERYGKHVRIALDANGSYDAAAACNWNSLLEQYDNWLWFEEPIPLHAWDQYAHCRHKLQIPIAGGENIATPAIFHHAISQQALDIVQPDPLHLGGIDSYRDVLKLARPAAIRVSPHTFDGALARWYAILAHACLPPWSKMNTDEAIEPIEWDVMDNPFTELVPIRVHQGVVDIPDGTGIGLAIDEDMLSHYRWDGSRYW